MSNRILWGLFVSLMTVAGGCAWANFWAVMLGHGDAAEWMALVGWIACAAVSVWNAGRMLMVRPFEEEEPWTDS